MSYNLSIDESSLNYDFGDSSDHDEIKIRPDNFYGFVSVIDDNDGVEYFAQIGTETKNGDMEASYSINPEDEHKLHIYDEDGDSVGYDSKKEEAILELAAPFLYEQAHQRYLEESKEMGLIVDEPEPKKSKSRRRP